MGRPFVFSSPYDLITPQQAVSWQLKLGQAIVRQLYNWGTGVFYRVQVDAGYEHFRSLGRETVIIAASHSHHSDITAMSVALSGRSVSFMAKQELFMLRPWGFPLGWLLNVAGTFSVNRQQTSKNSLRTVKTMLGSNRWCLCLYPEGTRVEASAETKRQVRKGVATMARISQKPVLPAGIFREKRSGWWRRDILHVRFGPCLQPPGPSMSEEQFLDALNHQLTILAMPPASPTEAINPRTRHIDQCSTAEVLNLINAEDAIVAKAVTQALPHITPVVDAAVNAFQKNGRLIYVGAGTSGRLAVLDAAECPPTFGTDPAQVVALIAGGHAALTHAIEGAEDDRERGRHDLLALNPNANDVVIGISASGNAGYVCAALDAAKTAGATSAAIVCNPYAALLSIVQYPILIQPGPEVIAGSSRMKAGTAQKLILNMISTALMIRLGRTVHNLMVDLQPTNDKLKARAERIVAQLTGLDVVQAQQLLAQHHYSVKAVLNTLKP